MKKNIRDLLSSGIDIKSSAQIINKKAQEDAQANVNRTIIEQAKHRASLEAQGINPEEQNQQKVLHEMVNEEQPKIQIPVEDTENLIKVLEVQRNNALTRLAIEQARIKTLLNLIDQQKQTIAKQSSNIQAYQAATDEKGQSHE